MSKIEVDKVDPQSGTALEIGTSGDTVTVPSGVGLTLTNSTLLLPTTINTDKIDPKSGTALEIGTSGDTITVPTGAGLTVTDEVKTNKITPATGVAFTLGDSGDTFTVPSGATIVNSGTATGFGDAGRVLIKEIDASDVAAVSFVNGSASVVFDTTYDQYQLTFSNVKVVGDEQLRLQALASSVAVTSGYIGGASGNVNSVATAESPTAAFLESYGDVESDYILFGVANFYNVGVSSSFPSCYGQFHHERSSGTIQSFQFSGTYNTEISDFNGITFTNLGGPNIASGKFKLYGIS